MTNKPQGEYTALLRRKNVAKSEDKTHTVSLSTNYQSDVDECYRTHSIDDPEAELPYTDRDLKYETPEERREYDYARVIEELKSRARMLEDRSQSCSLLNEIFSDFCSIENQYVERLRVLRDKIEHKGTSRGGGPSGAAPVLTSLKSYIGKMAENHSYFLDSVSSECFLEAKNEAFQDINRQVDEMKGEFERYKADRLYYLGKMQESYYKAKNALALCLDATHQAPAIKTSVHRTVIPVMLSFIEVNNFVNKYDEFSYFTDFNNRVDGVIGRLADMERNRRSDLSQVVSKFIVYETSKVRNLQYDLNALIETLNNFDPSQDFQGELVVRRGPGPPPSSSKMFLEFSKQEIKELSNYLFSSTAIQPPPFKVIARIEENIQSLLDGLWSGLCTVDLKDFSDTMQSSLVRQIFCDLLWKSTSTQSEVASQAQFQTLVEMVEAVLLISERQADHWCGYSVLKIADKYRSPEREEEGSGPYLQARIASNGYWRRVEFWEHCLTIVLSLDLKALFETASCLSGSIGRIECVPSTEDALGFRGWMLSYGVPGKQATELMLQVCARLKLPQPYTQALTRA